MRFTVVLRDADFDKSAHAKVRGHYSIKQVKSLAANAFSLSADSMVRALMWTACDPRGFVAVPVCLTRVEGASCSARGIEARQLVSRRVGRSSEAIRSWHS